MTEKESQMQYLAAALYDIASMLLCSISELFVYDIRNHWIEEEMSELSDEDIKMVLRNPELFL